MSFTDYQIRLGDLTTLLYCLECVSQRAKTGERSAERATDALICYLQNFSEDLSSDFIKLQEEIQY